MNILEAKKMVDGYFDVVPEETARQLVLDPLSFFGKPSAKKLIPFPSNIVPMLTQYVNDLKSETADIDDNIDNCQEFFDDFLQSLNFDREENASYAFGFMADFITVCAEGDEEKIIEETLRSPYLILAIYECFIGKERDARESNLSCALCLMGLVNKYVNLAKEADEELVEEWIQNFAFNHNALLFHFSHEHVTTKRLASVLKLPSTLFYIRLEDRRKGNYKLNLHLKKVDLLDSALQQELYERLLPQIAMLPYFDKIDYMDLVEQIDNISAKSSTLALHQVVGLEQDGVSSLECWNLLLVNALASTAKELSLIELHDAIKKYAEPYVEKLRSSGKYYGEKFVQSLGVLNGVLGSPDFDKLEFVDDDELDEYDNMSEEEFESSRFVKVDNDPLKEMLIKALMEKMIKQ